MTTTTKRFSEHSGGRRGGFTLVEVMVAVTLFGLVLGAASGSLLFIAKSSRGMGNYQEMNTSSRMLLDQFASDARMAADVNFASATRVSLEVYNASGGTSTVIYEYNAGAGTFTRAEGGKSRVVLRDILDLTLTYYTLHSVGGAKTTTPAEIKEVQLEASMIRQTLQTDNTNYILSARFMMRNKSVAA